jgi:hypothetical protein
MTKQYRTRPVIVDAMQWDGSTCGYFKVNEFAGDMAKERTDLDFKRSYLYIETLNGDMLCHPSDYIIKDYADNFYTCSADLFNKVYEEV